MMLNFSTSNIELLKFKEYHGIILVFSCIILFFDLDKNMLFFLRMKTKIGSPFLDFAILKTNLLAGNDHVIDILTSEDVENISLCIFRYLTVLLYIK